MATRAPSGTAGGRAHLKAMDDRCDTVVVLNMAARRRPGRRFADMNCVAGRTHDWNLHWPKNMRLNGFTHILDGRTGKLRRCTKAEGNRAPRTLTYHQMIRYRKRIKISGRWKWVRPYTVAQTNLQAKRRLVRCCWELKSTEYASNPALARRMAAALAKTKWTSYVMTLVNMAGFGRKLKNFKVAGMGTALQGHGVRLSSSKVRELRTYAKYIDAQWGSFAGGKRIHDYVKAA